jgi:hypothetical protein
LPLRGDEIRGCWEASALPIEQPAGPAVQFDPTPADLDDDRTPVRRLEFVEVRPAAVATRRRSGAKIKVAAAVAVPADSEAAHVATSTEPRWSLWGDTDP